MCGWNPLMESYIILEEFPTPAEYNLLRQAVGWRIYDEKLISAFLPNSLYCLCARMQKNIIGMARVIGDGGLVFYIQDVIVLPKYQRQKIGSDLMDRVMNYLQEHAHHNTILGLMAAVGKEAFYEKYGFIQRPNQTQGAGMTLFWKEDTISL